MKFGILVCLLVVVACHEALGLLPLPKSPVLLEGDCKLADLPKDIIGGCNKITCEKNADGKINYIGIPCAEALCAGGKKTSWGPADLTKTYPACCPAMICK